MLTITVYKPTTTVFEPINLQKRSNEPVYCPLVHNVDARAVRNLAQASSHPKSLKALKISRRIWLRRERASSVDARGAFSSRAIKGDGVSYHILSVAARSRRVAFAFTVPRTVHLCKSQKYNKVLCTTITIKSDSNRLGFCALPYCDGLEITDGKRRSAVRSFRRIKRLYCKNTQLRREEENREKRSTTVYIVQC